MHRHDYLMISVVSLISLILIPSPSHSQQSNVDASGQQYDEIKKLW